MLIYKKGAMKDIAKKVCMLVLCTHTCHIFSVTTGSNTTLSQVATLISYPTGANSVLLGAEIVGGFTLAGVTSTLSWGSLFSMYGPITMNGGAITLTKDFVMQASATLVNGGIFNCAGFNVIFPPNVSSFVIGTSASTFNTGTVVFQTPVSLNTTINFGGVSTLDANGQVISFGPAGGISVVAGGRLLIKNAVMNGVSGTQISCANNAASLSLQNVTIIQDGPYTFNQGIMNILSDVIITGSNVFSFQSTNSLNINSFSTLFMDEGTSLNYDTTNASLLKFTDASSQLFLHGASLLATGTGINLIKGTLNVDSTSFFASSGTLGITIGSCVSANDCQFNLFNKSVLTVTQGLLNYKNNNAASFNMFTPQEIISMGANTTLNVYKTLTGSGLVVFGNNTTLATAVGASLAISSVQQGALTFGSLSNC